MKYRVRHGESPTMIARRFGVPFNSLIAANPHKPTTMVDGVRTWGGVLSDEIVDVPGVGGTVGDAIGDAVNALIAAGGPCLQANVRLVCAAQSALGFVPGHGVDGKWGNDASAAAKAHGFNVPACSPRPSWWAPPGQSNCPSPVASVPAPSSTSSLAAAAASAFAALSADSRYCTSVGQVGTAVNTAVHNFKAAWNAANPSHPVPIGTGKYESVVASALSSVIGHSAPPGCDAAAPTSTPSAPAPAPVAVQPPPVTSPVTVTTVPTPAHAASVPSAVLALLSFNPCDQANSAMVGQAQAALGLKPGAGLDGKYGDDTAALARKVLPNAPAGCSPRPAWWTPKGQSNVTGPAAPAPATQAASAAHVAQAAASAAQTAATPSQAAQAAATATAAAQTAQAAAAVAPPAQQPAAQAAAAQATQAAQVAQQAAGSAGGGLVAPEPTKLSKGAIIAGAVGAAALVGLIAVAASGKKHHGGGHGHPAKRHGKKHPAKHHGKRKSTRKHARRR